MLPALQCQPTGSRHQQASGRQLYDSSPPPIVACVQVTAKVRLPSWCAMRRGCSPRGTVRMCSFCRQQKTRQRRSKTARNM